MKNFIYFLILILILFLCGLWSPWVHWDINWGALIGITTQEKISGLNVFSLEGEIEVFIDDKLIGTADPEKPLFFDKVTPGRRYLKLVRKSSIDPSIKFWKYEKTLEFVSGTSVVASYNLGPTDRVSEGQIIYAAKKKNSKDVSKVYLTILNAQDFSISVDSSPITNVEGNKFEIAFDTTNQKTFKISKTGYENIEFILLPSDPDDRNKLRDYNLNVDVILMKQMLDIQSL